MSEELLKAKIDVFDTEDKFFIFNKIFKTIHSLFRKNEIEVLLGYHDNSLLIYGSQNSINKIIERDNIKRFYNSNAFYISTSVAKSEDYYLERVNNKISNVDKRIRDKKKFLEEKGLTEEQVEDNLVHYRKKVKILEENVTYFLALKNNLEFPIFAKIKYGKILPFNTNTYALKRKF